MSNLTCPGCGSVYPLAAVQKLDHFTCAVCHQTIVVPIAGPAASRAAPPATAARAPAYEPPPIPRPAPTYRAPDTPRVPRHSAPKPAEAPGANWGLIGAAVAIVAAIVVGVVMFTDKSKPADHSAPQSAEAPKSAVETAPAVVKADPEKDPAAWKALPAAERADRTIKYLAALDRRNGSVLSSAYTFLKARDESDAIKKVVDMELARDPSTGWAHQARGDVMILDRVEHCLAECTRADEADTPAVQKLTKLRKDHQPESGTWWADAALEKEVDAAIAQIRADEKALQDPYEWAVAKWKVFQRTIEVMRDHPAITGTVGPYLIFVQVKAPAGTPIESVPEAEMSRANRVLFQEKSLFSALYDGFHETFGRTFGLSKYDKSNSDLKTILKVNIFADEPTWELYHQRAGFLPQLGGLKAYYQSDEPRFVVSYDPADTELAKEVDQMKCHEGVHQILHFSTWDVSRKADSRELAWVQCDTRPMWLDEGFADFFSSFKKENGRYQWMQPIEPGMQKIWVFSQVFAKKKWAMWSLDELLAIVDSQQVTEQAGKRVVPKSTKQLTQQQVADVALAVELFRPVFYAKAWSLVYFLWNQTDAAGKPVYRDRFSNLLKDSLRVKQTNVPTRGLQTNVVSASDFRKALGLESEDRYRAFEKEWLAWEASFVGKAQKPAWAASRDGWLSRLGLK